MKGHQHNDVLNSNAVFFKKPLGDLAGITGFGFHLIEVKPGRDTTEFHLHHLQDECIYILSGSATANIGDQTFQVQAGDFIGYRKGGLPHSISNTGNEIFRYLVVGERLAHDVKDYPQQNLRMYTHAGLRPKFVNHDDLIEPIDVAKRGRKK